MWYSSGYAFPFLPYTQPYTFYQAVSLIQVNIKLPQQKLTWSLVLNRIIIIAKVTGRKQYLISISHFILDSCNFPQIWELWGL